MELKDILIGSTLKEIDDDGMTLIKDGKEIYLHFETDGGDCCGWASINSTLYLDSTDNMPVVTNVEICEEEHLIDGYGYDSCTTTIVLFGLDKTIAKVEAAAGSGSGWCYGATARVTCSLYDIDEILASW